MAADTDISNNQRTWLSWFPSSIRDYLLLARFDRPIGAWLLWIPCSWGILLPPSVTLEKRLWLALWLIIGSFVMRAAGCVVNDMWDRDIDKRVERTLKRPIACGRIRLRSAAIFLIFLLFLGLCVLAQLNFYTWLCCLAVMPIVFVYPLAKRFTWCPQFVLGLAYGSGSVIGYVAACNYLSIDALWLYVGSVLWVIGYDTIYGFQDIADDKIAGVKSFSQVIANRPRLIIGCLYGVSCLMIGLSGFLAHIGWLFWPFWLLACIVLLNQARRVTIDNPQFCGQQFLASKNIGFLFTIAFFMGLMTQ